MDVVDTGATVHDGITIATARAERIGRADAALSVRIGSEQSQDIDAPLPDHAAAARRAGAVLRGRGLLPDGIDAIGHRIVHGGARDEPTRLDADVVAELRAAGSLAPLHNDRALATVNALQDEIGATVPAVAVFDTAFHRDLPLHAAEYALPADVAARHRIRRHGFHGLAHRSMCERWSSLSGTELSHSRIVTFQLGNGCSAAAVQDGRVIDTSMGFTPLEGLMMGTRCGDLDPSVPAYLARAAHLDADEVERVLNEQSGLLGIAGTSDMQVLLENLAGGDGRAELALAMFCHRARKYLGAYLTVLGGADAVVFGGGIGEHAPEVRRRICEGTGWLGLELDPAANRDAIGGDRRISTEHSPSGIWVIAVDEASIIAYDTAQTLGNEPIVVDRSR